MGIFSVALIVFTTLQTQAATKGVKNIIEANLGFPLLICQKGKFYSQEKKACLTCKKCDLFSVQSKACKNMNNTVCVQCLSDTGDLRKRFNNTVCKTCKPCGPGTYVRKPCNPRKKTKTVCKQCPTGSFKVMTSFSSFCVPCTSCGNMEVMSECTSTNDTKCGQCKPGYYRDRSRNVCYPCRSCMPDERHIEECKNGHGGKLCGGPFFRPSYRFPPLYIVENFTVTTLTTTTSTTMATYISPKPGNKKRKDKKDKRKNKRKNSKENVTQRL